MSNTQAAQRLKLAKLQVLERWERRVRDKLLPTTQVATGQMRNSLPEVLDVLISVLTDSDPQKMLQSKEALLATSHGKIRAGDPNYSLDNVTDEYHLLQKVIFEVLEEGGQAVTAQERDLIQDVIMRSVCNAGSAFKAAHDQQQGHLRRDLKRANDALELALKHKSAEAGLQEQLLDTSFERVQDYAIFTLNEQGQIASWSAGCKQIKQYSAEDVMGRHYAILYPPEGRNRGEPEAHLEIAQRQGRFRGEGLRMRKDGDFFLADVFIAPMYDGDRLLGFFKIVSDLTERYKLIQEIDMSRARVEVLKIESELRDQFIALISHDLRNPLSAAHMNAQLIARTACDVENHVKMAHRNIKHLSHANEMISNLLDASRIKSGDAFPLNVTQFDISEVARDLCDDQVSINGRQFQLNVPDVLIGFWDRSGLKRVLENLVGNVVKYGESQEEVTMSISQSGERVIVEVHNHGSVIHVRDQESLFKPFYRTDTASKSSSHGWGLGLTLVRGITEAHGGMVKVRSLPAEGTTFTLDLPMDSRTNELSASLQESL